jgi:hypothetical protein
MRFFAISVIREAGKGCNRFIIWSGKNTFSQFPLQGKQGKYFGANPMGVKSRLSRPDAVDMELDTQPAPGSAALVSMATLEQTVPAAGEPGTECVLLGNAFNGNCIASFGDVDVPTKFWYASWCQKYRKRP